MFSAGELAAMAAEVASSLGPGSGIGANVVLLRGAVTLPAQAARLVRPSSAGTAGGAGTESAQAVSYLVGAQTMDVRPRDRFTLEGLTYEVVAVLPRRVGTLAQVRSLQ